MKGSTLKRGNITREKIAMLENLARYNTQYLKDAEISTDKQEELDALWRNFKIASKTEKSSVAFFTSGVFVGAITTLALAIIISFFVGYSKLDDVTVIKPIKPSKTENLKFTFVPADTKIEPQTEQISTPSKEYIVQSGDSLESIAIKFYGSYDEMKIKSIELANDLANPNAIGIGQKLTIPINN